MTRPEGLTTHLYSLGAKLLVVCASPRQPCLHSATISGAFDTYLYFCESAGDKPWYLFREKFVAILHLNPSTWGNQRGARSRHYSMLILGDVAMCLIHFYTFFSIFGTSFRNIPLCSAATVIPRSGAPDEPGPAPSRREDRSPGA